jgi:glycine dehydrogenase subunit 2
MFVRAYTYIRMHGAGWAAQRGRARRAERQLPARLVSRHYHWRYDRICMHEFVVQGDIPGTDVRALDVAKRLIDYGVHPPTNYFPLIVHDALMIEPTETESQDTLDSFAEALVQIAEEARTDPELLHNAPHTTPVRRLDEVKAARNPVLCYRG